MFPKQERVINKLAVINIFMEIWLTNLLNTLIHCDSKKFKKICVTPIWVANLVYILIV